ncbi:conserved hypothetical protein [Hyella patelloides LEGE 07179]|uniref:Mobilization protein MobC n=1 Tax=Hyella patelloides LEGE 07179 TaxID=945734 RepID=A0A563VWP9_9CYAN|nr:hypothetical protein [Hyella patelloides]VEP15817.1 conserved hypothetical protein [Hyella patelloides LEGE 07179]
MVKTKPNQKIHVEQLKTTLDKLGQLKEKPKSELTLRESIYFLRDKLKSALKKGYSYQDLSEILEEQEILISASTLKQYLTDISKESASKRKRSKSRQNKKDNLSETASPESSLDTSSLAINKTKSEKELDKDLNQVESDNNDDEVEENSKDDASSLSERELSKSNTNKESNKSQSRARRKSTKTKPKGLSGNKPDLSEDFNQY